MLKVNKKVEYALMALKFMAQKKEQSLTTTREICDEFNIPFDTTAKVLQTLNNKNILKSVKGIKGGYSLLKDLESLTYMELCTLIEGVDPDEHFCTGDKGLCNLYKNCNIATPLDELNKKLGQFLDQLTLRDLLLSPSYSKNKENL